MNARWTRISQTCPGGRLRDYFVSKNKKSKCSCCCENRAAQTWITNDIFICQGIFSTSPALPLTLQACASSLSALWASSGFWMTRPPAFPEKSMATRLASDLDCTNKHTWCETHQQMWAEEQISNTPPCLMTSYPIVLLCRLRVSFLLGFVGLTSTAGSYTGAASRTGRINQTHNKWVSGDIQTLLWLINEHWPSLSMNVLDLEKPERRGPTRSCLFVLRTQNLQVLSTNWVSGGLHTNTHSDQQPNIRFQIKTSYFRKHTHTHACMCMWYTAPPPLSLFRSLFWLGGAL